MAPFESPPDLICPECGRRYAPGFIFCPVDGAELPVAGSDKSGSLDTTQRPPQGVPGPKRTARTVPAWVSAAVAALLLASLAWGVWRGVRPYELIVEFPASADVQAGDRVFIGKSAIGSVHAVATVDGTTTTRLRIDSEHIPEMIQGTRFFALPEVPFVSPKGIHVFVPDTPDQVERLANRSQIKGETSAGEFIGLIAREKGLTGISDFTSGFGELIIPSSRKRSDGKLDR